VDERTFEAHPGYHQRAVSFHVGESVGLVAEQVE
jgi:hypothetical protein